MKLGKLQTPAPGLRNLFPLTTPASGSRSRKPRRKGLLTGEGRGAMTSSFAQGTVLIKMLFMYCHQWRRQDLLRGVAKMEIMSWALTVNFRAGCSICSMTNNFMIHAVLIERAVSC